LEMLERVLIPFRLPIIEIGENIQKFDGEWAVKFKVEQGEEVGKIEVGVSGKIIPKKHVEGNTPWFELVKARIHSSTDITAEGELHGGAKGNTKEKFMELLSQVKIGDYMEIDPFGVTSKLESALTEAAFTFAARDVGYVVIRMPEDKAKHLGEKRHFDFLVSKNGVEKRVELKSLWGTDTSKARLIHTKGGRWITSSCRFEDQDIFAVNLWLRTGNITDIAYARSVFKDDAHLYGLPCARADDGSQIREHVHQNPRLEIGDGVWFASLDEVWNLP